MPPKSKTKSVPKQTKSTYSEPFLHYHIPNFLPPQIYEQLVNVYKHLQFKNKQTDLFNFFQTDELADYKKLDFFKK